MVKLSCFYLVLVGTLIGFVASTSTETNNAHVFLHIGPREAAKDNSVTKTNTNESYHHDSFSLNNLFVLLGILKNGERSSNLDKSPVPLVNLAGNYYYFGTYFKANFFKAMEFCRDHGMTLLSIESADENTRILNYLAENLTKIDHFWTSGSDLGEEGHFVWLATGKTLKYTYWSTPQPDNAGKNEHCMEIWKLADKHYVWNDIPCTNSYNFICEVQECHALCKQ